MNENCCCTNVVCPHTGDLQKEERMGSFETELSQLINRNSLEGFSNTQDFILASYLRDCLDAYNKAVAWRDRLKGPPPMPAPLEV